MTRKKGRRGFRSILAMIKARQVLPQMMVPVKYTCEFEPDLDKFTFLGVLNLLVDVHEATSKVIMNAVDLEIESVSSEDAGAGEISVQKDAETVTFSFANLLKPGRSSFKIRYSGMLNDKLKGFYRSKYMVNDVEKFMACTQMEPVDCRRVLPCWDEPAVKAVFAVSLRVENDLTALSNMPAIDETVAADKKKKLVRFQETPKMSSYLLAMAVGEFDYVEGRTHDTGVLVRCYTPKGKAEQGRFALEVALGALPFYNRYFGSAYPLPKCDMIAVANFAMGAMENWGLITYRETCMLVDPVNSSTESKQYVAIIVAHELAHQWFGNLVTMEWWDGLWLNEGFASWVEYLCVDHLFPKWSIWMHFLSDMGRAFELDAKVSSHPVEVPIHKAADVAEIFDAISYSKGCAVIRMLQGWLGAEPFRQGLIAYLDKHKYGNATTDDLWHALGAASKMDVASAMNSWIRQTGYPVLTVEEETAALVNVTGQRTLRIKQKRFLQDGGACAEQQQQQQWSCPVSWVSAKTLTPTEPLIIDKTSQTVAVNAHPDEWIKLNVNQKGFYRILYPAAMLDHLRIAIQEQKLDASDRLGLANDTLSLCQAGLIPASVALSFVSAYAVERDYAVWVDLATRLADIDTILSNSMEVYPHFQRFCLRLFGPIAHSLGWDVKPGENYSAPMLRALVLNRAARYGDGAAIEGAKKLFAAFLVDRNKLAPDLRSAVFATVLRAGGSDPTVLDQLLTVYRESESAEEKSQVLCVLGTATDQTLLQRVLDFSLSHEVRSQDTVSVIDGVARNRFGRILAWKFVRENWSKLVTMFEGGPLMSNLIQCASSFATEEQAMDIEKFHASHVVAGNDRTVKQTVESIRMKAKWLERDEKNLLEWLVSQ
jgi:puromycin-sensitive aminopeptidase